MSSHRLHFYLALITSVAIFPVPAATDAQHPLFRQHEPPLSGHFGSPAPGSDAAFAQFSFLIGRFHCDDQVLDTDGSYVETDAIWTARYILNGQAIQDSYWNENYAGTSVRYFDATEDHWVVDFYGGPPLFSDTWTGHQLEDGRMQLINNFSRPDGTTVQSRLTFFNISNDGFHWTGERIVGDAEPVITWKIECQRKGEK